MQIVSLETICIKCQNIFFWEKIKNKQKNVVRWIFYPAWQALIYRNLTQKMCQYAIDGVNF